MKKQSRGILSLWALIAALVAIGIFFIFGHLGVRSEPSADISATGTAPTAVAIQTFSNDGYTFSIPASWNIERTGPDTIAVHSGASSSGIVCKIEVSAFALPPDTDTSNWIAHRIGADPSLIVTEESSEDVSFASGTGVKWIGTIDEVPTTLVYAFNGEHAYEIAPSAVSDGADGSVSCDDMLETFLSTLII